MAKNASTKKKTSARTSEARVTRITATDSSTAKPKTNAVKPASSSVRKKAGTKRRLRVPKPDLTKGKFNPLRPMWQYLKGSWAELRQVRWPDRRATWGMTGALLGFVVFFVIVIVLLDAGFEYLFNLIIGK